MADMVDRAWLIQNEPAVARLLKRDKLFAFLPEITKTKAEDMAILRTWIDYFVQVDAPFMVMDEGTFYMLWKEKVK